MATSQVPAWNSARDTPSKPRWISPPRTDAIRSSPDKPLSSTDGMDTLRRQVVSHKGPFKCALDRGTPTICSEFRQGFQGRGAERYETGEVYVGEYMAGERYGKGTFRHANGQTLVSNWKDNRPVGEGVQWSQDHKMAARLKNGVPVGSITPRSAASISARIGMPVPGEWLKQ